MSLFVTYLHFLLAHGLHDFLFYWAHRLFHWPPLYRAVHKKHHEFVGTVAVASEYNHPLEALLANLLPTIAYTTILMPRLVGQEVTLVWFLWRLVEGYEAHSGYNFQGSFLSNLGLLHASKCRLHDWHHTDNRGCFGVSGLWDYYYGTMDSFVQLALTHPETKEVSIHEYHYDPHADSKSKSTAGGANLLSKASAARASRGGAKGRNSSLEERLEPKKNSNQKISKRAGSSRRKK